MTSLLRVLGENRILHLRSAWQIRSARRDLLLSSAWEISKIPSCYKIIWGNGNASRIICSLPLLLDIWFHSALISCMHPAMCRYEYSLMLPKKNECFHKDMICPISYLHGYIAFLGSMLNLNFISGWMQDRQDVANRGSNAIRENCVYCFYFGTFKLFLKD